MARQLFGRLAALGTTRAFHQGLLAVAVAVVMSAAITAERPVTKATVGKNVGKNAGKNVGKKPAARTAWGDPDLTGIWTGSTITPLERPSELGRKGIPHGTGSGRSGEAGARLARRWPAAGRGPWNLQSGLVRSCLEGGAEPPNVAHRRASRRQDSVHRRRTRAQARARARYGKGPFDSALDLDTGERCLTDGLPLYFGGYNNNYQFFQSPSSVVILHELYHEPRVIYADGRPHANIRTWLGDSRGHWEGNTLVVDTINSSRGNAPNGRMPGAPRARRPTSSSVSPAWTRKRWSISSPGKTRRCSCAHGRPLGH